MGIVFDCEVVELEDGTVEATPIPESARFVSFDRDAEDEEAAS